MHSFKIPFTGEILTFFAIFFLSATGVKWKIKGLIWRAGMICAMMKFFTPGVKVFGPIIGIISESLVMEALLSLLGMNILGFIIAGGITLCVPLLQKIINLLILYGWNLVIVFEKSIDVISGILKIESIELHLAIIILFSINFIFGSIAGLLGYRAGKRVVPQNTFFNKDILIHPPESFPVNSKKLINILLKILINASIIIFILVLFKSYFAISVTVSVIYILFLLWKYKRTKRIFTNYKLWLQIILFITLTALILSFVMKQDIQKTFYTVLEMLCRVVILTAGFSVISTEIGSPEFMGFLRRRLNTNFSEALNLSFAALPEIIRNSPGIKSLLKPSEFINHITSLPDVWHSKFTQVYKNKKDVSVTETPQ